MDNKVVQTLARAFVQCGWTALRFNFRGVGASEGAARRRAAANCEDMLARGCGRGAGRARWRWPDFRSARSWPALAVDALWAARAIDKIVLVGTAASRFMRARRCRPRPTSARWWSTASRTTRCRSPP